MRDFWLGVVLVLAAVGFAVGPAVGPAVAGQGAAQGAPPTAGGEAAAEQPTDLQGCSACTLRRQNMTKRYKELQAAKEARGVCQIKGDIGEDGTRVYHLPGEARYGWTWVDEAKGERWFCSVEEAEAAGWRAAD